MEVAKNLGLGPLAWVKSVEVSHNMMVDIDLPILLVRCCVASKESSTDCSVPCTKAMS